jgi:hypothetical protein
VARRQVDVAGDGCKRNVMFVTDNDELLEFLRLAVQPIQPPRHHSVAHTAGNVGE